MQGVCGIQQTSWSQTAIVVIGGSDDEAIGHYAPVDSKLYQFNFTTDHSSNQNSVTLNGTKEVALKTSP
ncbi:MAG: hypothetical protein IPF93_14970 [Saprospiraceae bacterium]|nr:hypothetical protein [Saprospiraceae bacterium]